MVHQPDFLQTDEHVPWGWGTGNRVWSMIHSAASGDLTRLKLLVKDDPDLLHCMCGYRTPLHFAVRENEFTAAKWLLEQNVDGTFASGQYWHDSPLVMAKDRGYEAMSRLLAKDLREKYGICPAGDEIAQAIRNRDTKLTSALIATHGVQVADERGNQPLHWAVLTRQLPLIDWLLDLETDVNAARPDGARPVYLAGGDDWYRASRDLDPVALRSHSMLIGYLLAQGAEYDIATAAQVGDSERVRQLLNSDPERANTVPPDNNWDTGFPLKCAAQAGYADIVRLLLDFGADPNHSEHGFAPWGSSLYFAVAHERGDIAMQLLEHGANPNQEVESSGNCLHAARSNLLRKMLLERGARRDFFSCCQEGHADDLRAHLKAHPHLANDSSSFANAAHGGFGEVVNVFLEYQPDLWGRMPGRLGESEEIRAVIISEGMQPKNADWLGVHLIHHHVGARDPGIFNLWLSLGVDIDILDGEHLSSPLGWAAKHGKLEAVRSLLRRRSKRGRRDVGTAVGVGAATGHVDVASELAKAGAVEH